MPRNSATAIANSFAKGLITEATGLNFPENAVTDSDNVDFAKVGHARRRKGYDLEGGAVSRAYDPKMGILKEYVWNSVAQRGGFTFLVIQIGTEVVFYELTVNSALSAGEVPVAIDLEEYKAPGAPPIKDVPCSFTSGNGYLFIAHPYCDPVVLRFNDETKVFEKARITILIRDFQGVEDHLGVSEQPLTLSKEHNYNLKNQGWYKTVRAGTVNNNEGGAQKPDPIQYFPFEFEENV